LDFVLNGFSIKGMMGSTFERLLEFAYIMDEDLKVVIYEIF